MSQRSHHVAVKCFPFCCLSRNLWSIVTSHFWSTSSICSTSGTPIRTSCLGAFVWLFLPYRDKEGLDSLPPLSKMLNNILKWLAVGSNVWWHQLVVFTIEFHSQHYEHFIERLPFILGRINNNFCHSKEFECTCREFEAKKGCYMPYSSFLLKPVFHVTFYAKMIQSNRKGNYPRNPD